PRCGERPAAAGSRRGADVLYWRESRTHSTSDQLSACVCLCARLEGLTLPSRFPERKREPVTEEKRDDARVDQRMQRIGFHAPQVMKHAGDTRRVDQAVQPLPVAAAETA